MINWQLGIMILLGIFLIFALIAANSLDCSVVECHFRP